MKDGASLSSATHLPYTGNSHTLWSFSLLTTLHHNCHHASRDVCFLRPKAEEMCDYKYERWRREARDREAAVPSRGTLTVLCLVLLGVSPCWGRCVFLPSCLLILVWGLYLGATPWLPLSLPLAGRQNREAGAACSRVHCPLMRLRGLAICHLQAGKPRRSVMGFSLSLEAWGPGDLRCWS